MKANTRNRLLLAAAFAVLLAGFFAARSLANAAQVATPVPQPTMIPF